MKKVLLVASIVLSAATAFAGISNTKHDLSVTGATTFRNGAESQVCKFCHVPHNAATAKLLWARSAVGTVGTYYSNPESMNAVTGAPGATSMLCMSCHDGVATVGSVAGGLDNSTNLTSDLSKTHPIGMTYNAAGETGLVATPLGTPLFSGKVECASCHAVHDNTKTRFLRVSIEASALCIACHTK